MAKLFAVEHLVTLAAIGAVIANGAIVGGGVFLVIGLKITPRPGAVARVFGLAFVLMVPDAGINLVSDGNYMYLRHTPGADSLLDVLGPWPWYIVGAAALALVLFAILDLPFSVGRFRRRQAAG